MTRPFRDVVTQSNNTQRRKIEGEAPDLRKVESQPASNLLRTVYVIALPLLILFGFWLRLYALDGQSLWYDEGVTATMAQRSLGEVTRWTARDIQPPLYYWVTAIWGRLGGWSEWNLRFVSAVAGTLCIPLMASITTLITRRRSAGFLAALITSCHPLFIYYSQEARMYTTLTAFTLVAAYCIARLGLLSYRLPPAQTRSKSSSIAAHLTRAVHKTKTNSLIRIVDRTIHYRHWVTYIAAATIAIYTHYFAFFLLLALNIAFLSDFFSGVHLRDFIKHIKTHRRTTVYPFLLSNIVILLLYLPWFAVMFTQLTVDTSYWQGQLKLWDAMRSVAIRFTLGETVLETEAVYRLWSFGVLTLLSLLLTATSRSQLNNLPSNYRGLRYTLLWVAVPVLTILGLASFVPKFNARYVMIALPGLILLWSMGLATGLRYLMDSFYPHTVPNKLIRLPIGIVFIALLGVTLDDFRVANVNWFTNEAFTKSQWRELTQYLRHEREEDEAILLVSGHAWPVWEYYASDLPTVRLPDLEILDVNSVLDFGNTALPLHEGLAGKTGAWLIRWQHRVVDPMKIVPTQLRLAGVEEPTKRGFWQLNVAHFTDLDVDSLLTDPVHLSESSINFGDQVYLLAYEVASNGDLVLFWQRHPNTSQLDADLHMMGYVYNGDGLLYHDVQDQRPTSYEYPSFRWQSEQVIIGRIPAIEWAGPGALPGTYRFNIGVYDPDQDITGLDIFDEQQNRLGKQTPLEIKLPTPVRGDIPEDMLAVMAEEIPMQSPRELTEASLAITGSQEGSQVGGPSTAVTTISDGVNAKAGLNVHEAEPGQPVELEIHWTASKSISEDTQLQVRWLQRIDPSGLETAPPRSAQTMQILALSPEYPISKWPPETFIRTRHTLRVPMQLPADDYWLQIDLLDRDNKYLQLPIAVLPSTRIFDPPPVTHEFDTTFGRRLSLRGVLEPLPVTGEPDQTAGLTFVWQAEKRMESDYTLTVQWLLDNPDDDAGATQPARQVDIALPAGTSNWLPHQVELQFVMLPFPIEAGIYRLIAAVYDAGETGFPRLEAERGRDFIELGKVAIGQ
ncbi:MAG: glycosyltransferase family 39 protein [Chloroflexota bacterium]